MPLRSTFALLITLLVLFALPVFASEVTGSLCTGVGCGVEGTVIASPTASPVAGTYTADQSVVLTATGSSSIHYRTDGISPTCTTGTTYSGAISVTSTTTIKAISCYPNSQSSSVVSFIYTLQCATTSVSNGSVAAYSACTITCDSGYTLSGSSCEASGGGGGGGGSIASTTPTPTPAPSVPPGAHNTPASHGFTSLAALGLTEGDTVSCVDAGDPDIYIANAFGYKRLFLNPIIFSFYGHLGGFNNVNDISCSTRDTLVTSGLFRNCEINDQKVYGVEIVGEDTGMLHWINTTGAQAVADDPEFFKKVFCINNNEFNWYPQGIPYTSVNQIPEYNRQAVVLGATTMHSVKVVGAIAYLNVRDAPTTGTVIGQLQPSEEVNYTQLSNGWYQIEQKNGVLGWVSGQYVTVVP